MALKLYCVVTRTDEIRRHTFRLLKQKVSLREHNLKLSVYYSLEEVCNACNHSLQYSEDTSREIIIRRETRHN